MFKVRRAMKCIAILILSILLFGCADIDLKSSTIIDKDGAGTVKLQIIYDDLISAKLQKDIIDHRWAKDNGYVFEKKFRGNATIEEITYKFNGIDELEQKINSSGLATMTYMKKSQVNDEDISTIELKFNKSAIDKLINDNINNDEKLYNYIKNIKFLNEVTVPGSIVKSNTSGELYSNTKEWAYKLSQIDNNTYISLAFK